MSEVPHPSDSLAQRAAESLILAELGAQLGVELQPTIIAFDDGVRVQIDGATADRTVLVEIYAHVGALRGAQPRKLATDAFKLVWAGQKLGASRLILAVVDEQVAAYLRRPKAWLTAALRDAGIEVVVVPVGAATAQDLQDAQVRQYR